jgi:hypothetical protein
MVMMLSLNPPIVYPSTKRGRVRRWPHATPRAGTFARAGKNKLPEGSDDGSLTTPSRVHGEDVAS